jgi:magnesium chelatase subunit I
MGASLRRCLELGETLAVPRITDIRSTYPSITGKLELEYEVAEAKEFDIVDNIAKRATKIVFDKYFNIDDLSAITEAFENGMVAEISQFQTSEAYMEGFNVIPGIKAAAKTLVEIKNPAEAASAIEFVLEGLHLSNKLNREAKGKGLVYK